MIFEYIDSENKKYVFDFDSYTKCVEIMLYEAHGAVMSCTVRKVKSGKVIWSHWDDFNISIEAARYCDRLAKNLAFA